MGGLAAGGSIMVGGFKEKLTDFLGGSVAASSSTMKAAISSTLSSGLESLSLASSVLVSKSVSVGSMLPA